MIERDAGQHRDISLHCSWIPAFELGTEDSLEYGEAIKRIEAAQRFGIDPSLEPMRALLETLGHPELAYRCVQIAGTNGKTSTSRYTAAILHQAGLHVGLYTSPHLVDYEERVEIDGEVVSKELFARGISWALAAWTRLCEDDATFAAMGCTEFELLTAAAFVMYALAGVEIAVLEVGLGGRWDATSAAATCACAVTGIGLDHMQILGDTLGKIAGEKAAVIRAGNPCVLGTNAIRPQEVLDVMLDQCERVGVTPRVVVNADEQADMLMQVQAANLPRAIYEITHVPVGLGDAMAVTVTLTGHSDSGDGWKEAHGTDKADKIFENIRLVAPSYQAQNIACAVGLADAVITELDRELNPNDVRQALRNCPVPGRFEVINRDPLRILDACHNPQSAQAFATAVEQAQPHKALRPTLLFGALADKDHLGIARVVAPLFDDIVVTQSDSPRALSAQLLANDVWTVTGKQPIAFDNAQAALDYLAEKPFLCCGTITLIGEIKALLG